jgi:hypothetical protein
LKKKTKLKLDVSSVRASLQRLRKAGRIKLVTVKDAYGRQKWTRSKATTKMTKKMKALEKLRALATKDAVKGARLATQVGTCYAFFENGECQHGNACAFSHARQAPPVDDSSFVAVAFDKNINVGGSAPIELQQAPVSNSSFVAAALNDNNIAGSAPASDVPSSSLSAPVILVGFAAEPVLSNPHDSSHKPAMAPSNAQVLAVGDSTITVAAKDIRSRRLNPNDPAYNPAMVLSESQVRALAVAGNGAGDVAGNAFIDKAVYESIGIGIMFGVWLTTIVKRLKHLKFKKQKVGTVNASLSRTAAVKASLLRLCAAGMINRMAPRPSDLLERERWAQAPIDLICIDQQAPVSKSSSASVALDDNNNAGSASAPDVPSSSPSAPVILVGFAAGSGLSNPHEVRALSIADNAARNTSAQVFKYHSVIAERYVCAAFLNAVHLKLSESKSKCLGLDVIGKLPNRPIHVTFDANRDARVHSRMPRQTMKKFLSSDARFKICMIGAVCSVQLMQRAAYTARSNPAMVPSNAQAFVVGDSTITVAAEDLPEAPVRNFSFFLQRWTTTTMPAAHRRPTCPRRLRRHLMTSIHRRCQLPSYFSAPSLRASCRRRQATTTLSSLKMITTTPPPLPMLSSLTTVTTVPPPLPPALTTRRTCKSMIDADAAAATAAVAVVMALHRRTEDS